MSKNIFENIVETAQGAFWESIAKSYPNIPTGDLSPESVVRFSYECQRVVMDWIAANYHRHSHDVDCHPYLYNDMCEVCSVTHGDPCPECGQKAFHFNGCSLID